MKDNFCIRAAYFWALTILFGSTLLLRAQSTEFIYQGQLTVDGTNVNGVYDFTFSLYNSPTNGDQVGDTLTNDLTTVTNGRFTVPLDFGIGVFDGTPLWLELGVRPGGSNVAFTILSPDQELTATPYALFALSGNASGLTGIVPDSSLSTNVAMLNQGAIPSSLLDGTYNSAVSFANSGNQFAGTFFGNGSGLTNVPMATTNVNLYNSSANPGFLTMNAESVLNPAYGAPLYIGQVQVPQSYTTDPHPDTINKMVAYNEVGVGQVVNPQEPAFSINLESDWANYSGILQSEFYYEYTFPYTNYNIRPFHFNFVRSTNTTPALVNPSLNGGISADSFDLGNFDDSSPQQVVFNMSRGAGSTASMTIAGTIYTQTNAQNGGGLFVQNGGSLVTSDAGEPYNMYLAAWEGQAFNHNPGFLVNNTNVTPYFYGQKTLSIYAGNAAAPAFQVFAAGAGQTGDLLQLDDSTGNVLANVTSNGSANFKAVSAPNGFYGNGAGLSALNWTNIANPPAILTSNLATLTVATNIAAGQAQLAVNVLRTNASYYGVTTYGSPTAYANTFYYGSLNTYSNANNYGDINLLGGGGVYWHGTGANSSKGTSLEQFGSFQFAGNSVVQFASDVPLVQFEAPASFVTTATNETPVTILAAAGQSADLLSIQSSNYVSLVRVDANGILHGNGASLTNLNWNYIVNPPVIPSTNGLASLGSVTNIATAQVKLVAENLATNLNWNGVTNPPFIPSINGLASYNDVTNIASGQAQLAVNDLATNLNGGYLQPGTVNSNAFDVGTSQWLGNLTSFNDVTNIATGAAQLAAANLATNLNWNGVTNPPFIPSTNGLASYNDVTNIVMGVAQQAANNLATNLNGGYLQPGTVNSNAFDVGTLQWLGNLPAFNDVTNIATAQAQTAANNLATNLNGAYLQPGTVNSNAFDAGTQQLLGSPVNIRNGVANIADSATVITVTFSSPLPDTNYSVVATPEFNTGGTTWWVDTKTTTGFNFNLASGVPGGGNVSWEAKPGQ